jgi:two-component system, sensor histidine kinase and response regulator
MAKVLVIEDEESVRFNMLELLEAEGFDALGASGGYQGVEIAQKSHPDLILCDIMMADLDGYGVLAQLRTRPETAMIPLIFVTAKTARADLRQGMQLGADDYLTKPFTQRELLEAVSVRIARHQQVNRLQEQVQALQRINILKDDLISSVSHDMRTPLMNMKLAIEMLQLRPDSSQREHYLEILRMECLRETELVENLLELQQLEDRGERLQLEVIDPLLFSQSLLQRFQLRAKGAMQQLSLRGAPQLPSLQSNPQKLERLLAELLNNACKYTAEGGKIELSVMAVGDTSTFGEASCLVFQVRNSTQIPAEALPHLFNKFYRVPDGDRRKQGGSGLGLALVHRLTRVLQGRITVNSEAGWTVFSVELPLRPTLT